MIEACHPLLVFSCVSSTIMQLSLLSSLSALASKTGAGGKKQQLLQMRPPLPTGGGTLQKLKSSAAATGPHAMCQPTCKDNIEAGVPSTTTMMMRMVAKRTTVGAPLRCLMGLGTSLRPPSIRMRQTLAPWGSPCCSHQDWEQPGVGGVGPPMAGPDDHRDLDGKKLKRA
jgi:hypothetical protein